MTLEKSDLEGEKIDFSAELRDGSNCTNVWWFLLEAISAAGRLEDFDLPGDGTACVRLTVNGRDVPFRKTFEFLMSQIDRMAVDRAEELLEERCREVDDILCHLRRIGSEKLAEIRREWDGR